MYDKMGQRTVMTGAARLSNMSSCAPHDAKKREITYVDHCNKTNK